jgi:hypothetical protein
MKKLVRDLIWAAAQVMDHDNDTLDGTEPHNEWARKELEKRITEVLKKHKIRIPD